MPGPIHCRSHAKSPFVGRFIRNRLPCYRTRAMVPLVVAGCLLTIQTCVHAVEESYQTVARPLLEKHCFDCHANGADEGGVSLDFEGELDAHLDDLNHWKRVWKNLRSHLMPPASATQPSDQDRAALASWIEAHVFRIDAEHPDPGRVTVRRLNREEYRNTIEDLFGVDYDVRDSFPPDDSGYGFDTIGDVLSVSPLLTEKYVKAATEIVDEWMFQEDGSGNRSKEYRRLFAQGYPADDHQVRDEYARRVLRDVADRAFRRPVDEETLQRLVEMVHFADQLEGVDFEHAMAHGIVAVLASPRFIFRTELQPQPDDPSVIHPIDDYALASRLSYFLWSSLPDQPLRDAAAKGELRERLGEHVERMLADERRQRFVRGFAGQWLRTRDVEGIAMDARRVLGIRNSNEANKIFNRNVRRAMRQETEMLFANLVETNGSLLDILDADYSFLNESLANFYGIPGVEGREMRRVDLPSDSHRRGFLTHGTFLLVTSNPTRTSPVKRGLFVLENLLGTPAPPPPPDVPPLEDRRGRGTSTETMREQMVRHRADPLCSSCHARMDPIGLALEHYNALGQWRDDQNGEPIDASGILATGEPFQDAHDLIDILANDRRQDYYRCVTEKMLTYALGRGIEYYDAPAVDKIVAELNKDEGNIRTLIEGVVLSAPFQLRRGDGEPQPPSRRNP